MDTQIQQNGINITPSNHSKSSSQIDPEKSETVVITTYSYNETTDVPSSSEDSDINFIRNDANRRSLNKEAYVKLHKNFTNRKSIETLKEKYESSHSESEKGIEVNRKSVSDERNNLDPNKVILNSAKNIENLQNRLSSKLSDDTVESLKIKYSPSNFGYPKLDEVKLRKRPQSLQKPILPAKPEGLKSKPLTRTSTLSKFNKQISYDFDTVPAHEVVLRSSSEDSIEKLETFMSEFTMDSKREVKEKKRSSSFRRILTGGLFSKDKKKSEKKSGEDKTKPKKTENKIVADNAQNEQVFNRNSTQRHTVDNHNDRRTTINSAVNGGKHYGVSPVNNLNDVEKKYAEMHINQFNKIKATFSNTDNINNQTENKNRHYVQENPISIDRYIDTTSSSSNTIESLDRSTYQNALIAQAEIKHLKERDIVAKQKDGHNDTLRNYRSSMETPPRAKETYQSVQLVKPKALIPINSERALPNPYHNGQDEIENAKAANEKNLNFDEKDYVLKAAIYNRQNDFDDVVYDYNHSKMQQQLQEQRQYSPNLTKSSTTSSSTQNSPSSPSFSSRSSPKSPTLEGSKLRLPSNREKVHLQPRIKSPIPQPKISTEKIIATELLKNKIEPKSNDKIRQTPQRIDGDYIDNSILYEPKPVNSALVRQSPVHSTRVKSPEAVSAVDPFEAAKWHQKQREFANSPPINDSSQVLADVMVHADPEIKRNSLQYSSLPPNMRKPPHDLPSPKQRPVTPVKKAPSITSLQQSPQKHEIRQSVELYCWKEIQKLKEKQDQELKFQLQYTPYGYVEDPIIQRRSRSVEPTQQRNTKRSASLPREIRQPNVNSRVYYREPIPENLPITYGENDLYAQKNNGFVRSSPQRRTVSGVTPRSQQSYGGYYANSGEVPYRPIFNRGSLNPQLQQQEAQRELQKKVSFNGGNAPTLDQSWQLRNGHAHVIPQKTAEKTMSVGDDDVFLRDSQIKQVNEQVQRQIKNGSQRESLGSLPRQQMIRDESPYGRTSYGSVGDKAYEPMYVTRQNRQNITQLSRQKQENLQNIYGTRQHPNVDPRMNQNYQLVPVQNIRENGETIYGSKQQLALQPYYPNNNMAVESTYGTRRVITTSPITKVTKQVTITNKVCDIYGNIHDPERKVPISATNSAQIQQTGVIYGQLQGNVAGRPPQYQSYNQIPPTNFVRGSRLTASANDMYKRYPSNDPRYLYREGHYGQRVANFNPNGPLPPTPNEGKLQFLMSRKANNANRTYPQISDTESDTSEIRKIMNRNYISEEEWNSDGKSGRGIPGSESGNARGENDIEIQRGRSRNARREDPRRHTLAGDQQYGGMAGQGGPLTRTMDLEGQPRGYPPMTNPMLFDDDPGIMSEVETSSTGFRRGGKQRSSLPVVRTPSKTLERPLGLVFLQYRNETKRALLPNEITSIDTVKALFVRSFPKQLTMEYLDSPQVKIYIHDSSKDMFYELEDLRSHLREIRDRSVLRLFESADVSGGLPMPGIGIIGGMGHAEDPSYFSEPEFDSEYQHQHIHKSKGSASKSAPYYMGSTASLPRSGLLRAYSPAVTAIPPERLKTLPTGAPPKPQRAYSTGNRSSEGPPRPPERFAPFQRPANSLYTISDGYMSSPERGSRYDDPYYSQYTTRSGSITPVIDEEVSDTELLDESYSLYGVKLATGGPRAAPRTGFPPPAAVPYDTTRIRVENMERQLANLTGLVQKALTQTPPNLQVPSGRDGYRTDKSVSFEKSVSFSDEPPDMNSPKQHSPQHSGNSLSFLNDRKRSGRHLHPSTASRH